MQIALRNEPLRDDSYERAVASLQQSLSVHSHRKLLAEIGVLQYNVGSRSRDRDERSERFSASRASFAASLQESPVQPVLWHLLADMDHTEDLADSAAEHMDWSIETAANLRHLQARRAILGILLWEQLSEASRELLVHAIVPVFSSNENIIVSHAVDNGVADDIWRRLRSWEPDGWVIAAEFAMATASYREALRERFGPGEPDRMRRLLAATTILATTGLPMTSESMTIHEYLLITRGEDTARPAETVDDYLRGVLDALLVLGDFNKRDDAALFCMPQQDLLSYDLLSFRIAFDSMLDQLEREMPEFDTVSRTRSVGLAALQLLNVLHPCTE